MVGLPMAPVRSPPKPIQRDYLSFSAISTFQSCPLKYYFRYVAGAPDESIAASLIFGSAIHAAVQRHFEELLAGSGPTDIDYLIDIFRDAWKRHETVPVQYGKREDFDSYCQMAERTLWAFLHTEWAYPKGQIIAVEEELRGSVVSSCPEFLARLDLLVDDGDEMVLTDFKTSRAEWSESQVQKSAPQLLLYRELARPMADGKPIKVQFAVMTKTKTPGFSLNPVEGSPQDVARTKRIIQAVWSAIQGRNFYPNPSPIQCPTCSYQNVCREWQG